MKNKKALVLAVLFLVGFFILFLFLAQENKSTDKSLSNVSNNEVPAAENTAVTEESVATESDSGVISVLESGVVSQSGNKVKLKFKIKNKKDQSNAGVKYFVNLHKYEETNPQAVYYKYPIDREVYPETLAVDADGELEKEITYNVPNYLLGKYHISMEFFQENSGFYLDRTDVGDIEVKNEGVYFLEINPSSCYLSIENDKQGDKQYGLLQGVDISTEENLLAHCQITNHYNEQVTVLPQFINYHRNDFLGKAMPQEEKTFEKLIFKAKESKMVTLSIPQAKKAQAYDAALNLSDKEGKWSSNQVSFHYVLAGESALIQTIQTDKENYIKGDMANISVMWSEAANSFPNSRLGKTETDGLVMSVNVTNANGGTCINEISKIPLVSDDLVLEVPLEITNKCDAPIVEAIIYDKNNQILDEKKETIAQSLVKKEITPLTIGGDGIIWVGSLLIVLILVVLIIFRKKIKKKNITILLMLAILVGISMLVYINTKKGEADSGVAGCDDRSLGGGCVSYCVCGNVHCSGGCDSSAARSTYTSADVHPESNLCMWGSASTRATAIPFPVGSYGAASRVSWRCLGSDDWNSPTCYASRTIPIPAVTLTVSRSSLPYNGGDVTLKWTTADATSCVASNGWSGNKNAAGGSENVNILSSATFSIQCSNAYGSSPVSSVAVSVPLPAAPTLTFSANPSSLILNSDSNSPSAKSTELNWNIGNASESCYPNGCTCTASGEWSGTKNSPSGSQDVQMGTYGNHTYTLKCSNISRPASSVTRSVTVRASCTAKVWYDNCKVLCGDGNRTRHTLSTSCVDSTAEVPCSPRMPDCPVSSEIREVR